MALLDAVIYLTVALAAVFVFAAFALPAIESVFYRGSMWLDSTVAGYQAKWQWKSEKRAFEAEQDRRQRQFLAWLESRAGLGSFPEQSDGELLFAQRLTPLIRWLIEEEIPAAIRRCNKLHRKLAIITGAIHMREIAGEVECVALRRSVVLLLLNSMSLLEQYPMSLRLEAEELLDASIALRKGLLPICRRCPYVQMTVIAAGEHCPASELIQIKPQ